MKASREWVRDRARGKLGRGVLAQDGGALLLARATDTPSSSRGWMETRGSSPRPRRPMQPTLSPVSFVR